MHGEHRIRRVARTQSNVALSSAEAERCAMALRGSDGLGARDGIGLRDGPAAPSAG